MAKQTEGFLGGFRGKLGPAVGYMWNGVWCVRSRNTKPNNPRTVAQTAHRELFKQEVQLAASMRWGVTTCLRDIAREEHMTAYNLFVHANQHAFSSVDGRLEVDYSALRLSFGTMPLVEVSELRWSADNVLSVRYKNGPGSNVDYVYVYVYIPELGMEFMSAPAHRRDQRVAVALPNKYAGHEAQVYLMVQNAQTGEWSMSRHLGAINIGEVIDLTTGELSGSTAPAATGGSALGIVGAEDHQPALAAEREGGGGGFV